MSWSVSIHLPGVFRAARAAGGLVLGLQVLLLGVGLQFRQRPVWLFCIAGIGLLALLGWRLAYRRYRAVGDHPTSNIATAAQGFVELRGQGLPLEGAPVLTPHSYRACLWYRHQVEESDSNGRWSVISTNTSQSSFILDDGTAQCLVDPEGAEVVTRHRQTWQVGDYRHTEWTLQRRDTLYVLGNFATRHPAQGLDAGADARDLLAEWKRDQAGLLKRFDLNHDGQVDDREWELARRLARGEVEKKHRELRRQPELHLVEGAPSSLYLISNHEPEKLARRFLWMGLAQLLVFFAALGWLAWWWRQPPGL